MKYTLKFSNHIISIKKDGGNKTLFCKFETLMELDSQKNLIPLSNNLFFFVPNF